MPAPNHTETGLRLEGQFENARNANNATLFKDMIREAFEVTDVIIGHHITFAKQDKHSDGFTYEIIQEIPSADALIFDHFAAQKIWGEDYRYILAEFAMLPIAERDAKVAELYYARPRNG